MNYNDKVRLSSKDVDLIKRAFIKYFLDGDHLWLFGSRANLSKRGGDIDLYIETAYADVSQANCCQRAFYIELQEVLGEQKIDIVLNLLTQNYSLLIYDVARTEGVRLV